MNILIPPQQNTPVDRWLTPMETLRVSGSQAKSVYALIDKSSAHFLLGFPRPVNGRWLESDVQKYLVTNIEVLKL